VPRTILRLFAKGVGVVEIKTGSHVPVCGMAFILEALVLFRSRRALALHFLLPELGHRQNTATCDPRSIRGIIPPLLRVLFLPFPEVLDSIGLMFLLEE